MQRLRQLEWNAAKTGAKDVTNGVMTGAKDVRTDVRRGAGAEVRPQTTGSGTGTK